ncbi:MAG: hypothetical protein ACLUVG_23170 [Phocaeicola vulgatus]
MSKNNIFKENFQRYIDGFYSKNELESILKQIKNYCTDEDIDQLTEQLWSNLGDETLANRFEKAIPRKEAWKLLAKSKRVKRMEKVRRFIYYGLSSSCVGFHTMIKGFGYSTKRRVEKRTPIVTVTTDYGEHKTIILPDNT